MAENYIHVYNCIPVTDVTDCWLFLYVVTFYVLILFDGSKADYCTPRDSSSFMAFASSPAKAQCHYHSAEP